MSRPRPIKPFRERRAPEREVADLLNLGPKSAAWLASIGLTTREQLAALGTIEVCRRLLAAGRPASVLLAYALEGALTHTHWNQLPHETKLWLRAEFAALRRGRRPS